MRGARVLCMAALAAAVGIATSGPAAAQEGEEDDGVTLHADALEVDLSGRIQVQAATSSCSEFPFEGGSPCTEQASGLDVFTRRVRLAAVVKVNEFITAKVEPDFGDVNEVVLRDAYGRLTFSDGAKVQIGQFKRPFDGFNLVSSSQLLTVERDLDVPGVPGLRAASLDEFATRFNLGSYDIGGMLFGTVAGGRLDYWVGAFNGEPSSVNNDRNADKQFVGRLRYEVETGGPPLAVAAAAALTDLAFPSPDDQAGLPRSGHHYTDFEVFAELGAYEPGPHVQAGLIFGDNPLQTPDGDDPLDPVVPGEIPRDFASMVAWQVVGAYRFAVSGTDYVEAVEPALRVTEAEPNTDLGDDEVWGFTPGVNIYFHGRNKLQLNWDFVSFADDALDSVNSFKAQFQAYF